MDKIVKQEWAVGNFIVWHKGDCTVFEDETDAMDFITKARYDDAKARFSGWSQSNRGNNMVAVLSNNDEGYQLEKREKYREFYLPKPTHKEGIK